MVITNLKDGEKKENIKKERFYGTGRRKTSVARVMLVSGDGKIIVNKRPYDKYFTRFSYTKSVRQPLETTSSISKFDCLINVEGGGLTGQAEAIKLGIARALLQYDKDLRPLLTKEKLLTRDPRMVERKKYGRKGARRRFQFSKR